VILFHFYCSGDDFSFKVSCNLIKSSLNQIELMSYVHKKCPLFAEWALALTKAEI